MNTSENTSVIDSSSSASFVRTMPSPACLCRVRWSAPGAHCWNVEKHGHAWHGKVCRSRSCWKILVLMCGSADCRGRIIACTFVEAMNNAGCREECRVKNDEDAPPDRSQDGGTRLCYECQQFTYLGRNCIWHECHLRSEGLLTYLHYLAVRARDQASPCFNNGSVVRGFRDGSRRKLGLQNLQKLSNTKQIFDRERHSTWNH